MTRILVTDDDALLDGAAAVWASATATRDGGPVAPLHLARPLLSGLTVVVALDPAGAVAGFAAVEGAVIRYVGVRPTDWGTGVGRQLMLFLPGLLAAAGHTHGTLAVYADNLPAVRLYTGLGWVPDGPPTPHPRSGRQEQRYRLVLPAT
ncbi:GNAT family N-acetyltransferase [Dactylosporangium sp. NPDC005555]|uniref:GNAT family N-acetyltransferase n=1 Tax=Dactylosporangium sp. NPDC005555 TaxID=3154889 RepID=UPI0033AD8A8A